VLLHVLVVVVAPNKFPCATDGRSTTDRIDLGLLVATLLVESKLGLFDRIEAV
jgi:hypothetical protein